MKLTLVFSTGGGIVSRAIRWFTRSRCSHVMIGLSLFDQDVLLHSTAGGVQFTFPRSKWFRNERLIAEYEIIPDLSAGVPILLEKFLNAHYDYVGVVGGFPLVLLWRRWFKKKIRNPLASPTALFCSEFVLHLDEGGRIPEWKGLDPERTHAQDLLEICETSRSFIRVQR